MSSAGLTDSPTFLDHLTNDLIACGQTESSALVLSLSAMRRAAGGKNYAGGPVGHENQQVARGQMQAWMHQKLALPVGAKRRAERLEAKQRNLSLELAQALGERLQHRLALAEGLKMTVERAKPSQRERVVGAVGALLAVQEVNIAEAPALLSDEINATKFLLEAVAMVARRDAPPIETRPQPPVNDQPPGEFYRKGHGTKEDGGPRPHVLDLQERLNALGHKVAVDGWIGDQTEAAIKGFQKDHGLPESGELDATTVRTMRAAKPLAEPRVYPGGKGEPKKTKPKKKPEQPEEQEPTKATAIEQASYVGVPSPPNTPSSQTRKPYGGVVPTMLYDPDLGGGDENGQLPPGLREATSFAESCRTCVHFDGKGECELYDYPVTEAQVCDSQRSVEDALQVQLREAIEARKAAAGDSVEFARALARERHLRLLIEAADSMVKATVHEPVGKPGGPGLWHHKGLQLPAYIQHIANDIREKRGKTTSSAIAIAIGAVKKWCRGGGNVDANTKAAACKAVAEWEALKATHSSSLRDKAKGLASKARDIVQAEETNPYEEIEAIEITEADILEAAPPGVRGPVGRGGKKPVGPPPGMLGPTTGSKYQEALHPRQAKGRTGGGEFASKGGPRRPSGRGGAASKGVPPKKAPRKPHYAPGMEPPKTQPSRARVYGGKKPTSFQLDQRHTRSHVTENGLHWGGQVFHDVESFKKWLGDHGVSWDHFTSIHGGAAEGLASHEKKYPKLASEGRARSARIRREFLATHGKKKPKPTATTVSKRRPRKTTTTTTTTVVEEAAITDVLGRLFRPELHPRNRLGQFEQVLRALKHGESARLPSGVRVTRGHDGYAVAPRKPTKSTFDAARGALDMHDKLIGTVARERGAHHPAVTALMKERAERLGAKLDTGTGFKRYSLIPFPGPEQTVSGISGAEWRREVEQHLPGSYSVEGITSHGAVVGGRDAAGSTLEDLHRRLAANRIEHREIDLSHPAMKQIPVAPRKKTRSKLEGPFTYRSGWKGYYDPGEGRYLGTDDIYMPRDFNPETGEGGQPRGLDTAETWRLPGGLTVTAPAVSHLRSRSGEIGPEGAVDEYIKATSEKWGGPWDTIRGHLLDKLRGPKRTTGTMLDEDTRTRMRDFSGARERIARLQDQQRRAIRAKNRTAAMSLQRELTRERARLTAMRTPGSKRDTGTEEIDRLRALHVARTGENIPHPSETPGRPGGPGVTERVTREPPTPAEPDYKSMPLHEIARHIERDWGQQGKGVNFAARPYLSAMHSMSSHKENYGADSGRSVLAYFLSNASSYRGPKAKAIKAELKRRLRESKEDTAVHIIDRLEEATERRQRAQQAGDTAEFARARALEEHLIEAVLTAKARKQISKSDFVFPEKAPGSGSYPIHDRAHGANALARAKGKSAYSAVKAKVCARYSDLPACSED